MKKQRVFVFIDGPNFYRRLIALLEHSNLGNYYDFFTGLLKENQRLSDIMYYIGKIHPDTGKNSQERKRSRNLYEKQSRFLNWLKYCGVQYKLGYFQKNNLTEKGVDVKIAVDMIRYAYTDKYDVAFLVSGDGDLVDAVEFVRELGKKVYNLIVFQSDRQGFSYRLRNACNQYFFLNRQIENFVGRRRT